MAQTGQTNDRILINISRARAINQYLGGPFVKWDEVDDLPDELILRIDGLANDLPGMREGQGKVDAIAAKWKAGLKK